MAKFVAIAAVCLAAILAVAVGQGEMEPRRFRDMQCRREVEESPLDACRQVLRRQLTSRMGYGLEPFRWSTGLRMQCCQQLQDVSRECRCAAIRRMVRGYEQTMPSLGEGGDYYGGESTGREYYGEGAQRRQQGPAGSYGCGQMAGRRGQQGGDYYGEGRRGQQGGDYYGEGRRQGAGGCGCGQSREGYGERSQPRITRVRVMRQYAAWLPTMCRMEPQECSIFGDYY